MKKYVAICIFILLYGCSVQKEPSYSRAEAYLAHLETLELNPKKYESYQQYSKEIFEQIENGLIKISDPEELRYLFWKCISILKTKPEVPQNKLQWIDPHWSSKNPILYRLAEIQTPDSAKVLVDLWADSKARWDGGPAIFADDAVVKCGKVTIPFLKKTEHSYRKERVVKLIESGATSGI